MLEICKLNKLVLHKQSCDKKQGVTKQYVLQLPPWLKCKPWTSKVKRNKSNEHKIQSPVLVSNIKRNQMDLFSVMPLVQSLKK